MLFIEFRFFVFLFITFAIVWSLRSAAARKYFLLAASYVFYAFWDWRFAGLILFVTVVAYFVGRRVDPERQAPAAEKKAWLIAGLSATLLVLGVFKYFNFFAEEFANFASFAGLPSTQVTLNIILPVGISFYTFQAISYMVDVRRGLLGPARDFSDVAFYIAFFPQLVAGPIVRATTFMPQINVARRWCEIPVRWCVSLFLIGFFKKACISDNISPFVDTIFAGPSAFDAASIIAGVFLYGAQIYCDFSGYSDMAIASAGLLGFKFPPNFRSPYLSTDIQDFWRRWHISLSTWLRDYLYIPLGGNRQGAVKRNLNLMTTMLLGGLWHGASLNFVFWGGLHGVALAVNRLWADRFGGGDNKFSAIREAIAALATVWFVNLAWIFFRATETADAMVISRAYVTFQSDGTDTLPPLVWWVLGSLSLLHFFANRVDAHAKLASLPNRRFAIVTGAFAAICLSFLSVEYRPFIYFQF